MRQALFSVLVAALVGLAVAAGFAGPVAADHAGNDADLIVHENITASDDTEAVWVDVAGADSIATADNTTTATVTVEGVNGSTVDELTSETLTIEEGNVSTSEYQLGDADAADYDDLQLTVEAATDTGEYINDSATEWDTTSTAGGGGGGLPTGGTAGGAAALVVLGGAYVVLKED